MPTRKDIDNLRKLIDKPTQVNITIVDKEPIKSSRGIDTNTTEKENRIDKESTFRASDIIDNISGPVVQDKGSDLFDHLSGVIGLVDNEDTFIYFELKVNGVFS